MDYISDLQCLEDCYPASHCLNSVLADYRTAGGVCQNSWLDIFFPGVFSTSPTPCVFHQPDDYYWITDIKTGLCSEKSQQLIRDYDNCGKPLLGDKFVISRVANDLIYSLCDFDTWLAFVKPPQPGKRHSPSKFLERKEGYRGRKKHRFGKRKKKNKKLRGRKVADENRLTPIENVEVSMFNGFNVTITSVPPLENTRHRYPWLCSLRGNV